MRWSSLFTSGLLGLSLLFPLGPLPGQLPTVLPLWNEVRRTCPVWRTDLNRALDLGHELNRDPFSKTARQALGVSPELALPVLRFSYQPQGYRCEATAGALSRESNKRYLELARTYLDWRVRGLSAALSQDLLEHSLKSNPQAPPGSESTAILRQQVARLAPSGRLEDASWVTPGQVVQLYGRPGVRPRYLIRDERLALLYYTEPDSQGLQRLQWLLVDGQEVSPALSRTFLHALEDASARTAARQDLSESARPQAFWHEVKRELQDRYGKTWVSPRELGYGSDRRSLK